MNSSIIIDNIPLTLAIASVSFLTLSAYYYYRNAYRFWSKQGVGGPTPMPVVGNGWSLLFTNRMKLDNIWRNKYGKVFGCYMGISPRLFVADAEVIQKICIKDFDVFPNHESSEFANAHQKATLFNLQDKDWKRVRALMTPTFTSGKIKRMFRFLDSCADDLVECFREQIPETGDVKEADVNVKDLYNLFTMDAITTCCYGLKLQREGATNLKTAATRNQFVNMAMKFFQFGKVRIFVNLAVPKPILRWVGFEFSPLSKMEPLNNTVQQLINQRRNSPKKYDDYLQLLVDAKLTDQMELNEMDSAENHHAGLTHTSLNQDQKKLIGDIGGLKNSKELSDLEILANATFLLSVGLETTGTLLCNTSYILAFQQDIQEKLYNELLKIVEYNDDKSRVSFSYDALTSCRYLDAVLSESLRYLTPVFAIDRRAASDYYIEKYDIHIKKGQLLFLGYNMMHSNPDYWEEPEKFNPDRFLPENKDNIVPGSYSPFGQGPRHCIGMRFSLTEAKLALAKIMMNFRFEKAPKTQLPPELISSLGLMRMKRPNVIIRPREIKP